MRKTNVLPLAPYQNAAEKRRLLLVLAGDPGSWWFGDIINEKWELSILHELGRASDLQGVEPCHVGLVQFGGVQDSERLARISDFLGKHENMLWIAILERDCLQNHQICGLLSDYFYDFHTLPLDGSRLLNTIGHAHGMADMAHQMKDPMHGRAFSRDMVGRSEPMQALFRVIRKVATADAAVLIRGESGTGKELAALALHKHSDRAQGPFIPVNCGALPGNLVQSTLFGYEKGAFTGAFQRQVGSIEAAEGGTIFLDEVGDLPYDFQVNLLRFLQEKTITRVGGTENIEVNARVIAATHVDLEKAVAAGRFREDLYYRLNVLHVDVPALRERKEDIPLLARFFFEKFRSEGAGRLKGLSQQSLQALSSYDWPGNVRELVNRVRRATVMCEGRLITPADLGLNTIPVSTKLPTLEQARAAAEKEAIERVLKHVGSNVSQAAKHLGISRVTLYRLIDRYGIEAHG